MVENHFNRQTLHDGQKEFEKKKADLEKKERELESLERSLAQKEQQFNMKWNILMEETRRLASDKEAFQRRMEFFDRVEAGNQVTVEDNIVHGEMFFRGVDNGKALKKRYKDLIKIYHPDSMGGDNATVQEINREYDQMRLQMSSGV